MMFCQACQADKQPAMDFRADGKFVEQCPTCTMPFNVGAPMASAPASQTTPALTAPPSAPSATSPLAQQIEAMRARLRHCNEQIALRTSLIHERDTLAAMLAIAEPAPTEIVAPPPN